MGKQLSFQKCILTIVYFSYLFRPIPSHNSTPLNVMPSNSFETNNHENILRSIYFKSRWKQQNVYSHVTKNDCNVLIEIDHHALNGHELVAIIR